MTMDITADTGADTAAPFRLRAAELKALSVRSDARGLVHLAGHLGALCLTGALVLAARGGLWVVPALVIHGYVLIFFFCALHEATHYTPFRSRWLSWSLGHFAGFLLLLPFEYFRLFHWDHHRFTQDPARDPELGQPHPATLFGYLFHVSGLPNWKTRVLAVGRHALTGRVTQPWIPAAKHAAVVREARVYVLGYAVALAGSVWLQSTALLWLWILPAMIGQLFLRNYLLAEHTGCETGSDPLSNTRTTYTNPVVRFFAWNMPYHVEHHAYPSIPFYALPRANTHLRPHIRVSDPGYIAALRSILRFLFRPRAGA
jgi:fatty acid desaturase